MLKKNMKNRSPSSRNQSENVLIFLLIDSFVILFLPSINCQSPDVNVKTSQSILTELKMHSYYIRKHNLLQLERMSLVYCNDTIRRRIAFDCELHRFG